MARETADVEMLVVEILRAALPGATVGTDTPPNMVYRMPIVRVRVLDGRGFAAQPRLATWSEVDVQCWHNDRQAASDLADEVRTALHDAQDNQTVVPGRGYVSSVQDEQLPAELSLTGAPEDTYRFQAYYIVRARAA